MRSDACRLAQMGARYADDVLKETGAQYGLGAADGGATDFGPPGQVALAVAGIDPVAQEALLKGLLDVAGERPEGVDLDRPIDLTGGEVVGRGDGAVVEVRRRIVLQDWHYDLPQGDGAKIDQEGNRQGAGDRLVVPVPGVLEAPN